jgi:AAA15 family ATPase/GTPase
MKVAIKRLTLKNFTVFEKIQIPFTLGVNVIIGENGTGKTHVMKVLYSACQAARPDISFSHKLVRVSKWEEHLSSLTSTFIPAKEILSNAWNLEAAVNMNNVDFDDTYVDIVTAAKIDISAGKDSSKRKKLLNILQKSRRAPFCSQTKNSTSEATEKSNSRWLRKESARSPCFGN